MPMFHKGDRVKRKDGHFVFTLHSISNGVACMLGRTDGSRQYTFVENLELVESFTDQKASIKSSIEGFIENAEHMHKTILTNKEKEDWLRHEHYKKLEEENVE